MTLIVTEQITYKYEIPDDSDLAKEIRDEHAATGTTQKAEDYFTGLPDVWGAATHASVDERDISFT